MSIKIEYNDERTVDKNWILLQKWKVQTPKINVNEIKVNYQGKNYLVIYPLNYDEKQSPVTVKDEETGNIYFTKFNTNFFDNFDQSKLEQILKKNKMK